jgi:hypothetical protein
MALINTNRSGILRKPISKTRPTRPTGRLRLRATQGIRR